MCCSWVVFCRCVDVLCANRCLCVWFAFGACVCLLCAFVVWLFVVVCSFAFCLVDVVECFDYCCFRLFYLERCCSLKCFVCVLCLFFCVCLSL